MEFNSLYVEIQLVCLLFLIVESLIIHRNHTGAGFQGICIATMLVTLTDVLRCTILQLTAQKILTICLVFSMCVVFAIWILFGIYLLLEKGATDAGDSKRKEFFWGSLFMVSGVMISIVASQGICFFSFSVCLTLMVVFANAEHQKVIFDHLTGIRNCYGLDEEIEEQLEQYRKDHNDSFYVISCDMDDFKTINDTWGHPEGNRALQLVAGVLSEVAEKYDATPFRIGGDEFMIITDKSDYGLAEAICTEVKNKLMQLDFRKEYEFKMSMGVSLYDGTTSITDLLNNADKVLYHVKRKSKKEA